MFCSQCGTENQAEARFCYKCGHSLSSTDTRPTANVQCDGAEHAIWNPNATAIWSLFFSPAFGSYLQMRNWRTLGEPEKAAAAEKWFHASLGILVTYVVMGWWHLVNSTIADLGTAENGLALLFLLVWYFASGREQGKYVKEKFGSNYTKKPWSKTLLLGVAIAIGYWIATLSAILVLSWVLPPSSVIGLQPIAKNVTLDSAPGDDDPYGRPASESAVVAATKSASGLAVSQQEHIARLMVAVFGKNYRATSDDALADLPDPDDRKKIHPFVLSAVADTLLPNGETVLVVNAEVAGEDGRPMSGHVSPGLLNVYFLRQEDLQWKVLRRYENIAALGSWGHIGEVVWITLAPGKPGLGVLHGGIWQGYTITVLSLFDLGTDSMRDLTGDGIKIGSGNAGACAPETRECWDIGGEWRFVFGKSNVGYDDLLVEFSGEESRGPVVNQSEDARETKRVSTKVHSSARYVFDGKRYQLDSGTNIVPDI